MDYIFRIYLKLYHVCLITYDKTGNAQNLKFVSIYLVNLNYIVNDLPDMILVILR